MFKGCLDCQSASTECAIPPLEEEYLSPSVRSFLSPLPCRNGFTPDASPRVRV